MKKLIFTVNLILVLVLFSKPCFSQLDLVLGLSKSSITGSESWKDPFGLQAGIIMPVANLSEELSLRAEANLSMQGAKWEYYDGMGRTNLLYLNLPVVVRFLHESGFFGEAGLQPGILLSAKDKWGDSTDDIKDQMKIFDIGIPVGIGYQINEKIGVGFRVIPGMINLFEGSDSDDKDHNLVFALRGTYKLNLKK
ncbi:MAG TPA: hypothetical protein DEO60_07830 [Bacteroidales bacterium]|nr:hypothetical protein [Bacteroidales bacterium]HBZ21019.1 hypothetical protein [Bacteroidales bacterium]